MSDARKQFIKKTFEANPDVPQLELLRAHKAKFDEKLSFVQIRRLRDAFKGGKFDALWDKLVTARVKKAANPGGKRGRQPKSRGERRKVVATRGRRRADMNKIALDEFSQHLVVFRTGEGLQSKTFKSRDRAEGFLRELLASNTRATDIAYYRQNPFHTNIKITIG